MSTPSQLSERARVGFQALEAGRYDEARRILQAEATERPNDASLLMGLAMAHSKLDRPNDAIGVLDALLGSEPKNFLALVMRADACLAAGRKQEAASFYSAAVSVAPPAGRRAPHIQHHVERATQSCRQLLGDYEKYLRNALAKENYDVAPDRPGSKSEALDILFGKRRIYMQQPEQFYYPGLPQRQFYEREEFDWATSLEAQTAAIADEAKRVLAQSNGFKPYLHAEVGRARTRDNTLLDNSDWSAAYLIRDGELNKDIADACPKTMDALRDVPLCDVNGKNPNVLFSMLRPKTRIEPHHGMVNTRLICHLPLIVPEGCILRVGNESRRWRRGELMVFDDSIEHEAENPTNDLRIILLFDIWRPELSSKDRAFVKKTFELIDAYQ